MYTDPGHSLLMVWSPDSRWIAYTKQLTSHLHAVLAYSLEQGKSYQLTDGMSDALYPAFDKGGVDLRFRIRRAQQVLFRQVVRQVRARRAGEHAA